MLLYYRAFKMYSILTGILNSHIVRGRNYLLIFFTPILHECGGILLLGNKFSFHVIEKSFFIVLICQNFVRMICVFLPYDHIILQFFYIIYLLSSGVRLSFVTIISFYESTSLYMVSSGYTRCMKVKARRVQRNTTSFLKKTAVKLCVGFFDYRSKTGKKMPQ